jgi:hypothetical protein
MQPTDVRRQIGGPEGQRAKNHGLRTGPLPMAGRWVANVGIDEDFAEVECDVP